MTSLRTMIEEMTLLLLPHGGQRTARRNAWRAVHDSRTSPRRRDEPAFVVADPAERRQPVAAASR